MTALTVSPRSAARSCAAFHTASGTRTLRSGVGLGKAVGLAERRAYRALSLGVLAPLADRAVSVDGVTVPRGHLNVTHSVDGDFLEPVVVLCAHGLSVSGVYTRVNTER